MFWNFVKKKTVGNKLSFFLFVSILTVEPSAFVLVISHFQNIHSTASTKHTLFFEETVSINRALVLSMYTQRK